MAPITNDTVAFLQEAKAALTELEELKNRHHELEITEKRLEKTLLAEKKAVDDNIELTVRERKEPRSAALMIKKYAATRKSSESLTPNGKKRKREESADA